ncbi:hypothetical protein A9Q74_14510 [Colwellia sp. 39_35_sub15_T18]|nr:hypothetical protein A9Q74_14510 [Colwellia sp. 39_35_sub15_T18]
MIKHTHGHALVKAVPGSGKTTTLIMRVTNLLKQGVEPQSILILMYNKAAQLSFKKKLQTSADKYNLSAIPDVRTFHSYALELVKEGQRLNLITYKELVEQGSPKYQQLLRECYFYGNEIESSFVENNEIEKLELNISNWRLEELTPNDLNQDPNYKDIDKKDKRAYKKYCELLEQYKLRTFDDILSEAVQLIRSNKFSVPVLKQVIVDEYQDVNYIQNELVKGLTQPVTNVMVVGDVNQCIYEWRGSRPDFIEGIFERDFKNTKIFNLSCTFRYGHQLSYVANSVISKNKDSNSSFCISHPKNKSTEVSIHQGLNLLKLLEHSEKENKFSSTAIIARSNADLIEPEIVLQLLNLPYRVKSSQQKLISRPEISLLTLLMCLAVDGDLSRIKPTANFQWLIRNFIKQLDFRLPKGMLNELTLAISKNKDNIFNIIKEKVDIKQEQNRKIFKSLKEINSSSSCSNMASALYKVFNEKGLFLNISESSILRRESNDQIRGISFMQQLLNTFEITVNDLLDILINPTEHDENKIRYDLTTMHGSKGLEWDNVILIGLEDKAYPGTNNEPTIPKELDFIRTKSNDDLKEERRLFYVAITRAIQHLHLIVPTDKTLDHWNKNVWSSTPKKETNATRFVFEMDLVISRSLVEKIKDPKTKIELTPRSKRYLDALSL